MPMLSNPIEMIYSEHLGGNFKALECIELDKNIFRVHLILGPQEREAVVVCLLKPNQTNKQSDQ